MAAADYRIKEVVLSFTVFQLTDKGSNMWGSSRYNANNAWLTNGSNGYLNNNNLYNAYRCVPSLNYLKIS